MEFSNSKSAVVLIEFQKQWTDPRVYGNIKGDHLRS